jgi:flagellar biosynthesis anti-sigma factor FlgM
MRIDKNRTELDGVTTRRPEATESGQAQDVDQAGRQKGSDKVELSSTAQFVNAATQAANDAPEVRSDAVARAKALLESGELGADPERFAKAMIDRALNQE